MPEMENLRNDKGVSVGRRPLDWDRGYKQAWAIIGWSILLLAILWLVARLWTVMLPLGIGLLIVFFLRPSVEWLAERQVPRLLATAVAYLVSAGVLAGAVALLAPTISLQAQAFARELPELVESGRRLAGDLQQRYSELEAPAWLLDLADRALAGLEREIRTASGSLASTVFATGRRLLGIVTGLITGAVIGFYLLYSLPRVAPGVLEASPPGWRRDLREVGQRLEDVVGGFVRGQLLVALAVGVLTWLGMLLVGMPYSLLLGIIAGVTAVVPFLGPIVAGIVAAVVGLLEDPVMALWALAVVFGVQQIESSLLSPKIMGEQVGLHPVLVILAIIAGTTLFGFAGLVLAVPALGVLKVLYGYVAERRGWKPW